MIFKTTGVLLLAMCVMIPLFSSERLQSMSEKELQISVGNGYPCPNDGAATNLVDSACGFDALTCSGDFLESLSITDPTVQIPGTGITLPFGGTPWSRPWKCKAGTPKSKCTKRQNEQVVAGTNGNRLNDDFPACGGTYNTYECRDKFITYQLQMPVTYPKLTIVNGQPKIVMTTVMVPLSAPVNVPSGCEPKPLTTGPNINCPNQYQTMKSTCATQ